MSKSIVCLISRQPIANLLPMLMLKPKEAVFLVSSQMQEQAFWLKDVVQPRGIKVEFCDIEPFDFADVSKKCDELIEKKQGNLLLNVTGGTKISALAAFQTFYFSDKELEIIYLDTASDSLLWLAPEQGKKEQVPADILQPKEYLAGYGKTIKSAAEPANSSARKEGLKQLCIFMVNNPDILGRFNGKLSNHKNNQTATLNLDDLLNKGDELIAIIEQCQAGTRTSSNMLYISSPEDIFFCHGGWLEEYVAEAVRDLNIKGCKPLQNVEIEWQGKGRRKTSNELDVLFCHRNRLHIISCKTANLDSKTEISTKGKEALYELDSLVDQTGGLFGKTMLCSVRDLGAYSLARARALKIEVLSGRQLLDLSKHLREWLR